MEIRNEILDKKRMQTVGFIFVTLWLQTDTLENKFIGDLQFCNEYFINYINFIGNLKFAMAEPYFIGGCHVMNYLS